MDAGVKWEIQYCMNELKWISSELEDVALEIESSISGMSTRKYTKALRDCADDYRKAARKLGNING